MYKLIAIDMDGTLLNSDGQISNENISAVKRRNDRFPTGHPLLQGLSHIPGTAPLDGAAST